MSFVDPVSLTDGRVSLVPLRPEHADGPGAAAADGEVWRIPVTSAPAPADAAADVDRALSTPDRVPFAVLDAAGVVLRSTSYHDILADRRRVEIGHTFYARRAQRTHVNTACEVLLLRHAFDDLGCLTVGWRTDPENAASRRAIERLGARLDGIVRGTRILRDGTVRDAAMYSMIRDEWAVLRQDLERRAAA